MTGYRLRRTVLGYDHEESRKCVVKRENARVAKLIGINPAARCTTVKPAGTTSLALGTFIGYSCMAQRLLHP